MTMHKLCSIFRSLKQVLFSIIAEHRFGNKINTNGATSETGTAYNPRVPEFASGFFTHVSGLFMLPNYMSSRFLFRDVHCDFRVKRCSVRFYSHWFCRGFLFYLWYLCTGVQHDFHIRRCSGVPEFIHSF